MSDPVKRICVIGVSGAGKTTFSRKLSQILDLPLYHMDQLYWDDNWTEISDSVWVRKENEIKARDRWIIEGYIDARYPDRLSKADLTIYLDYSGFACVWNTLKRWWAYRNTERPELAKGCTETLNMNFIHTILNRKERPEIEMAIERASCKNIVRLISKRQADLYLKELSNG